MNGVGCVADEHHSAVMPPLVFHVRERRPPNGTPKQQRLTVQRLGEHVRQIRTGLFIRSVGNTSCLPRLVAAFDDERAHVGRKWIAVSDEEPVGARRKTERETREDPRSTEPHVTVQTLSSGGAEEMGKRRAGGAGRAVCCNDEV